LGGETDNAQEDLLRKQLEEAKDCYKGALDRLRDLKKEIEHLQHLLQSAKVGGQPRLPQSTFPLTTSFSRWFLLLSSQVRLHRDFEAWQQTGGANAASAVATGDSLVDAEVRAFYEARGKLLEDNPG
jgi:hypothetical protein